MCLREVSVGSASAAPTDFPFRLLVPQRAAGAGVVRSGVAGPQRGDQHGDLGCARIAAHLSRTWQIPIAPSTVQRLLRWAGWRPGA